MAYNYVHMQSKLMWLTQPVEIASHPAIFWAHHQGKIRHLRRDRFANKAEVIALEQKTSIMLYSKNQSEFGDV